MRAFLLDNPEVEVSLEDLKKFGILYWKLSIETLEEDGILDKICKERGYTYNDVVTLTPEHLPNYEEKFKIFFEEYDQYPYLKFMISINRFI